MPRRGTGKTTQFHELLYNVRTSKVIGDDYLFASFDENRREVIVEQPEKQLYMRTEIAERHPTFIKAFNGLPLENVVVRKEDCRQKSDDFKKMVRAIGLSMKVRKGAFLMRVLTGATGLMEIRGLCSPVKDSPCWLQTRKATYTKFLREKKASPIRQY